jgi:hypothetical protein
VNIVAPGAIETDFGGGVAHVTTKKSMHASQALRPWVVSVLPDDMAVWLHFSAQKMPIG